MLLNKRHVKKIASNILSRIDLHVGWATDRHELQALLNRLKPISCSKELLRLGPNGDGGYLVPNDLVGIDACFSPGVSFIAGFEEDCARLGMKVFLADRSVEAPPIANEAFQFRKRYIGVTTNDDFMTLDDWVTSSLPESEGDLLLQIDVEGFEYEVFLGVSDMLLKRFRIIVAEFHALDQLWDRSLFQLSSRVFEKILQTHSCVHNHPNNHDGSLKNGDIEMPRVAEFTFLRNDRIESPSLATVFPHPLDHDNTSAPPLHLPECWYG